MRRDERADRGQDTFGMFVSLFVSFVEFVGISFVARRERTFVALLFGELVFAFFRGSRIIKNRDFKRKKEISRDRKRKREVKSG